MIWKLLKKNISVWQIAGYAAATLVGLAIIMVGMQFYRDASSALAGDNGGVGLMSARNIVISKPVSLSATLTGVAPTFTDPEIEEIAAQPWAGRVGRFQAADFSVHAGVEFDGRGMSTALFLESVPDDVLDVDSREWKFDPSSPAVPIIISKDYLALYNFGFASSGHMPMISDDMLKSVPLQITLAGNGRRLTLPGHIVGYSNWLNTVAVPQSFMDWAHGEFGSSELSAPSRLVVTVDDTSDPNIEKFLTDRDYELSGPGNDMGRAGYFLKLLTSVIVAVGGVITLLAVGILVLSLFLLVQKNRRAISGLLLLGYTPGNVSASYIRLVVAVNGAVFALACVSVAVVAPVWQDALAVIDIRGTALWPTLAAGLALMTCITIFNICVIKNLTRKIFWLN